MPFILKKILISEQMVFLYNQIISLFFILFLFYSGKTDALYIKILFFGLIISFLFNFYSIIKYYFNKKIKNFSIHSILATSFNLIFIVYSIYLILSSDGIWLDTGFFSIFVFLISSLIITFDLFIVKQEIICSSFLEHKLSLLIHSNRSSPSFENVITSKKVWTHIDGLSETFYYNGYIFDKYKGLLIDNQIIPYCSIKDFLSINNADFKDIDSDDIELLKMYII